MSIVQEFLYRTKMVDKNGTKKGVERMVEYLASPEIVNRMIIASGSKKVPVPGQKVGKKSACPRQKSINFIKVL